MARGMPPRPPAGGRGQPPGGRRGAQAPKTGQRPQKPAQKQGQQGQKQAQKAAQTRQVVEQQRRQAANAAKQQQQQKLRQAQFLREAHTKRRREEAERLTAQVREQVGRLESILSDGSGRSAAIDLDALYQTPEQSAFDPGPLATAHPEPDWADYAPADGLLGAWGARSGRQRREEAAREAFEQARQEWETAEEQRFGQLAEAERAHEAELTQERERVEQYNGRIARVAAGLRTREPAVVESFLRTVLGRVPLPESFPRRFEVAHEPETERLRLRLVLPGPAVVPPMLGYEYLPPVDEIRAVPRPEQEARELYMRVLAQVALLTLRDVFQAESGLAEVELHGLADSWDATAGHPVFACLLRMSVTRGQLSDLDLASVEPRRELARRSARVSPDPFGLEPLPEGDPDPEREAGAEPAQQRDPDPEREAGAEPARY